MLLYKLINAIAPAPPLLHAFTDSKLAVFLQPYLNEPAYKHAKLVCVEPKHIIQTNALEAKIAGATVRDVVPPLDISIQQRIIFGLLCLRSAYPEHTGPSLLMNEYLVRGSINNKTAESVIQSWAGKNICWSVDWVKWGQHEAAKRAIAQSAIRLVKEHADKNHMAEQVKQIASDVYYNWKG